MFYQFINSLQNHAEENIDSDRADSISVSQIMWITLAVVIVLGVGKIIYNGLTTKAQTTSNQINGN